MHTLDYDYNQLTYPQFPIQSPPPSLLSIKGTFTHKSDFIRKRQAQNVLNASHFADWQGVTLNVYVVILLKDTIQQSSTTAYKRIAAKFTSWLAYKRKAGIVDCSPLYIFTHENPNNNPHVNWCLHIPPLIMDEFILKLPRWIEAVQGELESDTLRNQPIKSGDYNYVSRYIIKGIDPDYIDHFGLRELYNKKGPQGVIYGQRAGFSRSLGPKSIRRANFQPMRYYHRIKRNSQEEGNILR